MVEGGCGVGPPGQQTHTRLHRHKQPPHPPLSEAVSILSRLGPTPELPGRTTTKQPVYTTEREKRARKSQRLREQEIPRGPKRKGGGEKR